MSFPLKRQGEAFVAVLQGVGISCWAGEKHLGFAKKNEAGEVIEELRVKGLNVLFMPSDIPAITAALTV